ncbi:tRNA lysidine(34) synthetase TilS [Dactylosporangium sucinum]|uniref:tRNA(Ile)-lysidine synthase n=1 Tax=Dactylosporangium sucinum TaxID=1424081 RepID=A0A917WVW8_9ACTN|nr:tRNA lysidine(34) synthetase TilS [Dactylosporangium sucinum]GGM33756.1 tRNA(Ile)-lysidine synthase [Dactylosporangium sucinum]
MAALAPAVAAVRNAVRRSLGAAEPRLDPGDVVLVACSGGADSLALAVAARFVTHRMRVRCGLVTVDHGLQDGSADRAARLAGWAREREFAPVDVRSVTVSGPGGPEASARDARYAALVASAKAHRAALVLLGHTRDDQAETVLLALTRGSGPRGLSGMPPQRAWHGVTFVRPLLDVSRAVTRLACEADGLTWWEDPHNSDPAYARSRLRPVVDALGERVVDNLARTARLVAADTEYLDELAADALEKALDGPAALSVAELERLPGPVRTRVLHAWARRLGVPGGLLSHRHVAALDALVTDWHGQGPAALPGGVSIARSAGRLRHDH